METAIEDDLPGMFAMLPSLDSFRFQNGRGHPFARRHCVALEDDAAFTRNPYKDEDDLPTRYEAVHAHFGEGRQSFRSEASAQGTLPRKTTVEAKAKCTRSLEEMFSGFFAFWRPCIAMSCTPLRYCLHFTDVAFDFTYTDFSGTVINACYDFTIITTLALVAFDRS